MKFILPAILATSLLATAESRANFAPIVSFPCGYTEAVDGFTAELTAVVEDDGLPIDGSLSQDWWVIQGDESAVSFSSPDQPVTHVTFSKPGEYVLGIMASDGELSAINKVHASVGAEGVRSITTYAAADSAYRDARRLWEAVTKEIDQSSGKVSSQHVGFYDSQFELTEDSEVIVTMLHDGGHIRNSLGWYDANEPTVGQIIWKDVSTGPYAPLEQGSKASLGLMPAGTNLRFFLIENGGLTGNRYLRQDSHLNPYRSEQVAGRIFPESSSTIVLGFEDRLIWSDEDYDDVVIQIQIIPRGKSLTQFDEIIPNQSGIHSDRQRRGVKQLLDKEGLTAAHETVAGVFRMPVEDTIYTIDFLDDRSSMKFVLGVFDYDDVSFQGLPNLAFREEAAKHAIILLDDRKANPGDRVEFRPADHGLNGKRVGFILIPNNTATTFLRNPFRYTPFGNGNRTKRQPLFTMSGANPKGSDQFLTFSDGSKTVWAIEDHALATDVAETGTQSDASFDDIQLRIQPSLQATQAYPNYYAQTIDYTIGHTWSDGHAKNDDEFDFVALSAKAALGATTERLLASSLINIEDRVLVSEFGEELPIAKSGAVSVNRDWEAGTRTEHYIGQQRYGADLIETGLILQDDALINQGINVIDWGLRQMNSAGKFDESGDLIHSTSLFLEGAARAGLLLDTYQSFQRHELLADWRRKVHLIATAFDNPELIAASQDVNLQPFAHRYYIRAAALMQASWFTRERSLRKAADHYVEQVLELQLEDGTLLERALFDSSYQMVGMTYAGRFYDLTQNAELKQRVGDSIQLGVSRFLEDVLPSGEVLLDPECRTATEFSRTGAHKRIDFKHIVKALVFAEQTLGMEGCENVGATILDYVEF